MGARGAASHGELNLSIGGGGDLPEVADRDDTRLAEGLNSGRPKGRRGEVRDRSERGRLSSGPRGVSWLTGGGPEVAVRSGSATTSTAAQWQQKAEEEEGAPPEGAAPFYSRWRWLEKDGASGGRGWWRR
jgi:hypothetical protein